MAASAKILTAAGVAFAAGVATTAALMSDRSPSHPDVRADAAETAKPVSSREAGPRAWADPVREKPAIKVAETEKPVFTVEADPAPAPAAKALASPPTSSLTVDPVAKPARRTAETHAPRPEPKPASPAVRTASVPAAEPPRRAETRRQRPPERRYARPSDDTGHRGQRSPVRDYAYTDVDPYVAEPDPYPIRRALRIKAEPRMAARRIGRSDGLMHWLAESDQAY